MLWRDWSSDVCSSDLLYEKNTGLSVIIMDITPQGLDSTPINIRGESKKLEKIGWKPMFSIDDILEELS